MKPKNIHFALSAVTLVATLSALLQTVRAADFTWTNGGSDMIWNTSSNNWTTGAGDIPWVDGNKAIFNATGVGVITVNGTRTISGMTAISAGYSLTGGQIELGAAATTITTINSFTINSPMIGGTNGLVKAGGSALNLSGGLSNSFSGPITVSAGRLGFDNGESIKNVTGAITVADGATFDAQQGYDANNIGNNISISGNGYGYNNLGALNIRENAVLTGMVTLNADAKITHDFDYASITGSITGTDTNLQIATTQSGQPGYIISAPISLGTGALTLTGIGTTVSPDFTLTGTNNYTGGTLLQGGRVTINNGNALGNGAMTVSANTTLGGTANLTMVNSLAVDSGVTANLNAAASTSFTQSGALTGDGALTKTGLGTVVLSGGTANTLAGSITVQAGTLGSLNSASLQNLAASITVDSGASFDAKAAFGAIITKNFSLSGTGSGSYGALNIRENANLSGAITLNTDSKITHDWNVATVSGSITGTDTNLELKTLQASQLGFVVSGPISLGTGVLTLTGIGTVGAVDFALSGTNSYSGGTLLKGGRVSISNASALGIGTVTFDSNSTLGGVSNLTHANALTVNTGVTATLDAAASTAFVQSGALTGSGTLTKSGLGTVTLSGGLANTFTGAINVNAGTLGVTNGASIKNITGAITVAAGATFDARQGFDSNNFAQSISIGGNGSGNLNHGALNVRDNANYAGAVTLTADSKITHDWSNGTISGSIAGTHTNLQLTTLQSAQGPLTISGPISLGSGGITVTGAGGTSMVTLSGTNNYTGETVVTAGTLKLSGPARLADSSTVRIATGAVLELNFTGTDKVAGLYLDNLQKLPGTYGSQTSTADHKSNDFSGNGILEVEPATTYATWASTNADGQAPSMDADNDGVSNGVEFFMGETGSTFTPNPSLIGGTVTWPRDPTALATYTVQTSTNLMDEVVPGDGGWAPATTGVVDDGTSVTFTPLPGDPKLFVRLQVTVAP